MRSPEPRRFQPNPTGRRHGGLRLLLDMAPIFLAPVLAIAAQPPPPPNAGPAGPVNLSRPFAAPAAKGANTVLGFGLQNEGGVPDALIGAKCAGTQAATLVGNDGRVMAQLPLGPGQSVQLAANGVHIVLHNLYAPAQPGEILHCTATFAHTGERLVEATVTQPPAAAP